MDEIGRGIVAHAAKANRERGASQLRKRHVGKTDVDG